MRIAVTHGLTQSPFATMTPCFGLSFVRLCPACAGSDDLQPAHLDRRSSPAAAHSAISAVLRRRAWAVPGRAGAAGILGTRRKRQTGGL